MDQQLQQLLQMLRQPAAVVAQGRILWCNSAGEKLLRLGEAVSSVFGEDLSLYRLWDRQGLMQAEVKLYGRDYSVTGRAFGEYETLVFDQISREPASSGAMLRTSAYVRRELQTIIEASELLADLAGEEEQPTEELQNMNRSVYRLLRMCNQISDSAKIQGGFMNANCCPMELSELMAPFIQQVSDVTEEMGRVFRYIPLEKKIYLDIDPVLVRRALFNLLLNALRYSPKEDAVTLRLRQGGSHIYFEISGGRELSVGSLLSNEAEPSLDRDAALGMGLDIARNIAALHGGTLLLSTAEDGQGVKAILSIKLGNSGFTLRSPTLHRDIYGGHNSVLVEFSDILDASMYHPDRV